MVALVGRPNVGKSTLFNRLAGSRIALVDDVAGVTRDRNYALMEWLNEVWTVIDTGGFEPETDEDILGAMRSQTEMAIEEADAIVFILDGKDGIMPSDHEVADILRRTKKPVFFAVNKVDGPRHEDKVAQFYELGVDDLIGISATHGYGVDDLLDAIRKLVPGARELGELEDEDEVDGENENIMFRVAVVGRPNVGKSTLINSLLGKPRLLVHDLPGTTRDAVDSEVILNGKTYLFVDTAGMRKKRRIDNRLERFSVMRTIQSLARCHLAFVIIDAMEGIVDQDAKIAGLAHERGRAVVLVFNKWDLVEDKEKRREELEDEVKMKMPHVSYAPMITISAKTGTRVGKFGAVLEDVIREYTKRIGTGELNRRLEEWVNAHHPPAAGGKLIKFYYASQTGIRPPTFVFFTNRPKNVPESYQRYLTNKIREDFHFPGTPIKAFFRPRSGRK